MRLLHTSDWHIGVLKHQIDRRPDHEHVFTQIRDIARDERVDLLLHTGDFFDVKSPSIETLRFGWQVLEELASLGKPIVVLCGNHDGAKLFEFMETLLARRLPIWFVEISALRRATHRPLTFPLPNGERIKIGAVPFVAAATYVREFLEVPAERSVVTYAEEVGRLQHLVGEWLNAEYDPRRDVRIFAAHLLVDGAQISGSEHRLYVESEFATYPSRIPLADYVAFGHMHKPQGIAGVPHGRYAGSPLPIDFGEREDRKGVNLVVGAPGRPLEITEIPLDVGRRLVELRGTLDELQRMEEQHRRAIARVIAQVDAPLTDLDRRVRDLFPQTTITEVIPRYPRADLVVPAREPGQEEREPTLDELFVEFLAQREVAEPQRVREYFTHFLHRMESGEETTLPDLEKLRS